MKGGITLAKKTQFSKKPNQINQIGDTVYLRKNIESITKETVDGEKEYWQADEETINLNEVNVSYEKIENNFDLYFDWAKERKLEKEKEKEAESKYKDLTFLLEEQKEQEDSINNALEILLENEGLI